MLVNVESVCLLHDLHVVFMFDWFYIVLNVVCQLITLHKFQLFQWPGFFLLPLYSGDEVSEGI